MDRPPASAFNAGSQTQSNKEETRAPIAIGRTSNGCGKSRWHCSPSACAIRIEQVSKIAEHDMQDTTCRTRPAGHDLQDTRVRKILFDQRGPTPLLK